MISSRTTKRLMGAATLLLIFCALRLFIMGTIDYSASTAPDRSFERRYGNIVASDLAVATTATVYSDVFPVGVLGGFGIWC